MTPFWRHSLPLLLLACALLGVLSPAAHADFAVVAAPPRFELAAKPGERLRQVLELTNVAPRASVVSVRTADWTLRPDLTVDFHDELQAGSCRPWVAIERREVQLAPGRAYRFRFEVSTPAEAVPTECRFALLIEAKDPLAASGPSRPMPVSGRLGIIVYVAVGNVAPKLEVLGPATELRDGGLQPALRVRNVGDAHGRLDGFLKGIDARGESYDVTVANSPVLPGETRQLGMSVFRPGTQDRPVVPTYPLTVTGRLEWRGSKGVELNQRFAP